jgi:mRNA interferase RelE/StbE
MYKLIVDKQVEKFIAKVDTSTRKRLLKALVDLAENPYVDNHVKRLKGKHDLFRKRVGDYRIIFKIVDDELIIMVLKIGNRGDIYK